MVAGRRRPSGSGGEIPLSGKTLNPFATKLRPDATARFENDFASSDHMQGRLQTRTFMLQQTETIWKNVSWVVEQKETPQPAPLNVILPRDAVRSCVATMTGADFAGWDELSTDDISVEFKRTRPLDYTFVIDDDGSFVGRAEVHFVEEFTLEDWHEPVRTGRWVPARVLGHVDAAGYVQIQRAELSGAAS